MLVQDHQHFAKQITIGLLIAFSYATVSLKLPKEVNEAENIIVQIFDYVPFCGNYCYFEIAYLLKIVLYPSLFNMTLNVSRIIDIEPSLEFKMRILGAQKQLTRVFLPLEMLLQKRGEDDKYKEFLTAEIEKEKKEAIVAEERKAEQDKIIADRKALDAEKFDLPEAEKKEEEKEKKDGAAEPKDAVEGGEPKEGDDNQLVTTPDPEEEKKKAEIAAELANFGKANPGTLAAFQYIIWMRIHYTTEFLTKRYNEKNEVIKGRSCIGKCGSMIKTLIIWAVVAVFLIPALVEMYNKVSNNGKSISEQEFETINAKRDSGPMTPEDIAKRA